jgi:hypothetical protein
MGRRVRSVGAHAPDVVAPGGSFGVAMTFDYAVPLAADGGGAVFDVVGAQPAVPTIMAAPGPPPWREPSC